MSGGIDKYPAKLLKAIGQSPWNLEELFGLCRIPEAVGYRCLTGQTIFDDPLKQRLVIVLDTPIEQLFDGN